MRLHSLVALVMVTSALLAAPAFGGEGREPSPELRRDLGAAWSMVEAGHLQKARERYIELLNTTEGRDHAEVYYGLSVVAWERRDARDAYQWLAAARRGEREGSSNWNPGLNDRWQRRIERRLRYIETNFSLRLLRPPDRGEPIPPLADPPPSDPVLREFAEAIPGLLTAALEDPDRLVFLMLPNGSWWVGDRLEWHEGAAMEPSGAGEGWDLAARSGSQADKDERRRAELASGGSLGRELIAKLMLARKAPEPMVQAELRRRRAEALAAEYAKRKPQLEALRARQKALMDAGRGQEADRLGLAGAGTGGQTLLTWSEITPDGLGDVAKELGEVWTEPGWHLRYAVVFPSKKTKWSLELPDLGVLVRVERGGEVVIQGTSSAGRSSLKERLSTWHLGARPNRVDVWFDGTQLKVSANGEEVGPVAVSRFAPDGNTRWRLATNDDAVLMFDVRVEAFSGF